MVGDSIKITATISKRYRGDKETIRFWLYNVFGTGWSNIHEVVNTTSTTETYSFIIPAVEPKVYAIGVSNEFATSNSYVSWKSYSFHVWGE